MTTVTDQPPPEQVAKTVQVTARAKNCASGYNDLAEFLSDHPHLAEQVTGEGSYFAAYLWDDARERLAEWVTAARESDVEVEPFVEAMDWAGVRLLFGAAFLEVGAPKGRVCEPHSTMTEHVEWQVVLPPASGAS